MTARATTGELAIAKRALHEFAAARAAAPAVQREQIALEFGDLFLTLLRLADRQAVDLIKAAEAAIDRRAARRPTMVSAKPSERTSKPRSTR